MSNFRIITMKTSRLILTVPNIIRCVDKIKDVITGYRLQNQIFQLVNLAYPHMIIRDQNFKFSSLSFLKFYFTTDLIYKRVYKL